MGKLVILRSPWIAGPVTYPTRGPVLVSATKFTYRSLRDIPGVALAAVRLLRGWPDRTGSIGVFVGAEPWKRTTYSMSVWQSQADLRRFVRARDHQPLVRRYRPRLEASASAVWETDRLMLDDAWREAMRRLAVEDPVRVEAVSG